MGKASNKKKSNKAARANIFDLSTLGIDIHAIAEEFKANLKDDLYADLYLAIKANEPSKLEKLIVGLLALGVKVYSDEISISNGELSDKVDLFQAAILNKSGNVLKSSYPPPQAMRLKRVFGARNPCRISISLQTAKHE